MGLSVSDPLERSGFLEEEVGARGGVGSCPQWKSGDQPFGSLRALASPSSLLSGIIFLTPCPSWAPELTKPKPSCGKLFPRL